MESNRRIPEVTNSSANLETEASHCHLFVELLLLNYLKKHLAFAKDTFSTQSSLRKSTFKELLEGEERIALVQQLRFSNLFSKCECGFPLHFWYRRIPFSSGHVFQKPFANESNHQYLRSRMSKTTTQIFPGYLATHKPGNEKPSAWIDLLCWVF